MASFRRIATTEVFRHVFGNGVLLLLRYLMDEPQPKWIRQFGAAYLVPVLMVAAGISILVVIGYG